MYWIAACCSSSRPVGRNSEERTQQKHWLRSYGRPRILVVDQQRSTCSGILAEKVESDGTRLEVTLLEAPWGNGKTQRAGKDWKEDCYKTTQDGPEAQTWTDFEEDCDAVDQARASKINDSGYTAYQRVFGRNPPQMEDAILECGADLGAVSRQQAGELTQERSMTVRRLALQASSPLDHKRRWKRALHNAAKHYRGELHVGQPLWFWRRGANAAKKPTNASWHQGVVISSTLATVSTVYRGSVVKCARSQVRPFHDDDEAAHEHVTEHMRDLGERLLHENDFSYEDITGQDEPPVDSPPTQGESTATRPPGRDGEGHMEVDPEGRRRMRGKTQPISLEQPAGSPVDARPDATPQEAERDHDDKRRRIDEPVSPDSTVAQDEAPTLIPVPFDSKTRNDEIAVDVPLPEEPTEMSGENGQGWITEEAFFTVLPGARQVRQRKDVKMNQLSPAERREFLKSVEVEWQTPSSRSKQPEYYLWKKRPKLERADRIVRWTLVGHVLGSRTKASHQGAVRRHDSSVKVLQTLTSLTPSHILRHLPARVF